MHALDSSAKIKPLLPHKFITARLVGFSLSACFSKAPYVAQGLNPRLEGLRFAETTG
jgi:hypothetical protein